MEIIHQRKQAKIEKYVIRKKSTRIDHNYRVGDQVMIKIKTEFKYETPFKGLYEIVQMWTNGSVTLRTGAVTTRVNISCIKPNKNNTEEVNVFNKYEI